MADAIFKNKFTLPYEEKMTIPTLLDHFPNSDSDPKLTDDVLAYYIQSQNNNMHHEFKSLLCDVPDSIDFADRVLGICYRFTRYLKFKGAKPDAANFWLGDSRVITSFHKDHYENLYIVVKGTKTFTLYVSQYIIFNMQFSAPPTDFIHMNGKFCPLAYYS